MKTITDNKKGGLGLKRKFKMIFWKSKKDQLNEGVKKDKTEDNSSEEDLQFDAVPDNNRDRPNNNSSDEAAQDSYNDSLNVKDSPNKPEQNSSTDEKPPPRTDSPPNDFKSCFNESKEENTSGARTNVIKNKTNIVVNGGSGIHIGNVFTTINNMQCPFNHQAEENIRIKKTEAIKGLIKSKNLIKSAHLQLISEHLGKEWKAIGNCMGLTTGETDVIEEKYKDYNERAFQMLNKWWQQKGQSITIGVLCKNLWETQMQSARTAVHQLSISKIDY